MPASSALDRTIDCKPAPRLFYDVFGLVVSKVVFAPEPSGFPDDIAQPLGELRLRLFTPHFASF